MYDALLDIIDMLCSPPARIDLNKGIEPWRMGVHPKPIIYHNPPPKQKYIPVFKGRYFAIGEK